MLTIICAASMILGAYGASLPTLSVQKQFAGFSTAAISTEASRLYESVKSLLGSSLSNQYRLIDSTAADPCVLGRKGAAYVSISRVVSISPPGPASLDAKVALFDRLGSPVIIVHAEVAADRPDSNENLLRTLRVNITAADRSRSLELRNLLKYGVALPDNQSSAFFLLDAYSDGTVVGWLADRGTAARAGLRLHDLVTSVNGTNIKGLDDRQLQSLIDSMDAGGGLFRLEVQRSGRAQTLTFHAEPAWWYAAHVCSPS